MKIIQILSRMFVEDLDVTLPVYETLLGEPCKLRFKIPFMNVELAQVGSILFYTGPGVEEERKIDISFVADNLEEWKSYWLDQGGRTMRDISPAGSGRNMILRHPDGTVAEYLELQ